ncbi:unnamed protein product [Brassicogethes aeneus]|uniref:C2H2-type domain-containing protein n=1 Tax=Brassicogethes aeneus TaxID=1431903 RepID=A0A9P0FN65_BRAAE|nr:unnamed protein product [Brassicogethes aeneus]
MTLLSCPFCCNEKFSSHSALKYHILSIVDNLLCPACNSRFESLIELAEHVGRECKDEPETPIVIKIENEEVTNDAFEAQDRTEENHEVEETIENIQLHIEEGSNSVNQSILAQALMSNSENVDESEDNPEETLYNCQMCDMNFNNIEEHLQNYHEGEEVVLETEAVEENDDLKNELATYEMQQDAEDQEEDEEEENTQQPNKNKMVLDEAQCMDKEGRLYTRKVVKIDKFWEVEDNAVELQPPTSQKYIINNGKIQVLTEEEVEAIEMEGKEKVVTVFKCDLCSLQFPSTENYYKHKCSWSNTKFKCTHCKAIFTNYKSLHNHMKYHVNRDPSGEVRKTVTLGPFLCEVCNTMFPSFKSLRLHKRMHDPIKTKEPEAPVNYTISGETIDVNREENIRSMFVCNVCNNTYDKEYEEIHMKSHTNDNNYDCDVCNRKFYTQENLDMHMKAHSNGKKFACSYCKKGFISFDSLQEHVKNQCQKRRYECQYCGRRFARPHEKVKHERIHTGEKPHVCQLCGKCFRVSYCLTLHMRTHSGQRPYHCAHCDKRFKSHSVYNHHLLTHSDFRGYPCPYCPKAFKTSVQLAGHKNSHTKPFACKECNRPFASLYAVRAHMETHKRENNLKYDCYLCGASYARSFALRDHMKAQHGGDEANSEILGMPENNEDLFIELETAVSTQAIQTEMEVEVEQDG